MRDWLINLPDELTETDLIEMVEGTLPAHREPVAIAALKAEPRLGLLIKQMRSDREAASTMAPSVPAPAEVGERVLSVIDRRMIRELDEIAREQTHHIPVSTFTIHEPTAIELFMHSAWTKRLAVAAGVLIAVGVGVLAVRTYLPKQAQPGEPIAASKDTPAQPRLAVAPSPAPSGTPGSGEHSALSDKSADGTLVAAGSAERRTPEPPVVPTGDVDNSLAAVESSGDAPKGTSTSATTDSVAPRVDVASNSPAGAAAPGVAGAAPASPDIRGEISLSAAAHLARDGRLVIIVHAPKADVGGRRALTLDRALGSIGAAECDLAPSPELLSSEVALMSGRGGDGGGSASTPSAASSPGTHVAGAADAGPDMSLSAIEPVRPAPVVVPKKPLSVYLASIEPSEHTLGAVRTYLERGRVASDAPSDTSDPSAKDICIVEFRVLATPIAHKVAMDPESILWWSGPASRWARLGRVPVIVSDE